MTIVNGTVPLALDTLGYPGEQIAEIEAHINATNSIVEAPHLKPEHLPVFDVAVGQRAISHLGHIKMMGAVQPFLSGAISKTVNMPSDVTVDDIADAYTEAWRLGVKALAIYRDGSKTAQALRTDAQDAAPAKPGAIFTQAELDEAVNEATALATANATAQVAAETGPARKRMPRERQSLTHKFSIGGHEGYITAGMYPDGTVGEIFLTDIGKEGSTLRGMMNSFATAISISLQYGVPLETLVQKFSYMRFEPEGITQNPEIPFAKSMPDYIMRWLASRFLDVDTQEELGILTQGGPGAEGGGGRRDVRGVGHRGPDERRQRQRRRPRADEARRPGGPGLVARHPDGRRLPAGADARGRRRADRHAAGAPGPHDGAGSRARLQPVRRDDAADRIVLHVQQLRQQHRLRLIPRPNTL